MTENRRIFWNVIATYARSLFALLGGIFCSRWALASLGASDYGLFGVVGGLMGFITFINNTFASANSRFYAVSIGRARMDKSDGGGVADCVAWFNTALSIHIIVPTVLLVVGYPIGVWAIKSFLVIPADRVVTCIWVFRLMCLSCYISMVNVPFSAMYIAKQYIAELTIYSYLATITNLVVLYYMASHPGEWLLGYGLLSCLIAVVPQILICLRSVITFPECKIVLREMWNLARLKQLVSFAAWNGLGILCVLFRVEGISILINKSFGPSINASNTLASAVDGHASSLSSSLTGSFAPAIIAAYGEDDKNKMQALAYRSCKFGALLLIVFLVPLVAELNQVLALWLHTVPPYLPFLCVVALLSHLAEITTQGHMIAIQASGQVREYQTNMTIISILTLPAAILTVVLGGGVYAVGIVLLCARICVSLRRVFYARIFAGLSAKQWISKVIIPVAVVVVLMCVAAAIPCMAMSQSLNRLMVVTVVSCATFMATAWKFALTPSERTYVLSRLPIFCRIRSEM